MLASVSTRVVSWKLAAEIKDSDDKDAFVMPSRIGCASDGLDNGPAAGGIADFKTKEAAKRLGLSGDAYLAKNDSFPFMKKTGSQIMTGLTEINISDLMLALRKKV